MISILGSTMKKTKRTKKQSPLQKLVGLQLQVGRLPDLSPIEKTKLDHALALDQLYYSSRVEGSVLTKAMIEKAVHGKEFSAA